MKNFDSNDDKEPKNPGLRGDTFRVYQDEAKLILMEKFIKDDNYSGWEVILGIDQGATQPGAPAMPAQPQALAAAQVRQKKRNAMTKAFLVRTQEDPRLKHQLASIPDVFVPGQDGPARKAWLLLVQQCYEEIDDSHVRTAAAKWNVITIKEAVGYSQDSIFEFYRFLTDIFKYMPANMPAEAEWCTRILDAIAKECPDNAVAHEAAQDLTAQAANRVRVYAPPAAPGTRSLSLLLQHYAKQWQIASQM